MFDKKELNIGIIWANPYNQNLGVSALAYSALAMINDCASNSNRSCKFSFIGSTKYNDDSLTINGSNIKFDNIIGLDFLLLSSWIKFAIFPKKYKFQKLFRFDIIFDIAEGDSYSDIYGNVRFNRINNSKIFFNILKKKQILLPQTIGPFSNKRCEKRAVSIMKKLYLILSRDNKSYKFTEEFMSRKKIYELIDLAFYLPFTRAVFDNSKFHVGVNVSALLWNGGYTGKNQFKLTTDYKCLVYKILDYFSTDQNVIVHLVPHVLADDFPVENDFLVCEEICTNYRNFVLAPKFKDPIEAKCYISGMDFFTGARMHSCIAAFSTGVPVVPIAYSRKFNGLFIDSLNYNYIADCVNNEIDFVFSEIINGFNNKMKLKGEIINSLETIVKPRIDILKGIILDTINN